MEKLDDLLNILNEMASNLNEKPAKGKKWKTNGVSHGDPNCLSRKKWKCKGKKSLKESFESNDTQIIKQAYKILSNGDAISPKVDKNFDKDFADFFNFLTNKNIIDSDVNDPAYGQTYFFNSEPTISEEEFIDLYIKFMEGLTDDESEELPEATSVGGMGGYGAFGYDAPAFMTPIKRKIYEYIKPLGGEYVESKDGKKVTPKMIKEWLGEELNEIHDKPTFNGGKIVKINPKCATFPYCSQGDSEDKPIKLVGETKDCMSEESWNYINEIAKQANKKPEYITKLIREYYLKK